MPRTHRIKIVGRQAEEVLIHLGAVLRELGDVDTDARGPMDDALAADAIVVADDESCVSMIDALCRQTESCHLPLVCVLGRDDRRQRMECFRAGATDVLAVDTDYVEVYVRLLNIMRRSHDARRMELERVGLGLEVLRRSDLLDETRLEITRLLGRAAEYRDNETGHHVVRVSTMCDLVCRALSLRRHESTLIAHASPLHDIGKIGVPDAILLKPGRLTDGERRIMRRHTLIGARILASSNDPLLYTARQIALNHHEHWNGGGYPRHLRGDRIPLSARVVAVCDVFDALTSRRPYKEPWSFDAALEYIESQSGMQFEPRVSAAFLEAAHDIIDIAVRFAEPGVAAGLPNIGAAGSGK